MTKEKQIKKFFLNIIVVVYVGVEQGNRPMENNRAERLCIGIEIYNNE